MVAGRDGLKDFGLRRADCGRVRDFVLHLSYHAHTLTSLSSAMILTSPCGGICHCVIAKGRLSLRDRRVLMKGDDNCNLPTARHTATVGGM
jgi:hypothetical protein